MVGTDYAITVRLAGLDHQTALGRVKSGLAAAGFTVATVLDVQATDGAGDGELPRCVILGATDAGSIAALLAVEPQLALLLPYEVVVWEERGGIGVAALDPEAQLSVTQHPELRPLTRQARRRLTGVLARLVEPADDGCS